MKLSVKLNFPQKPLSVFSSSVLKYFLSCFFFSTVQFSVAFLPGSGPLVKRSAFDRLIDHHLPVTHEHVCGGWKPLFTRCADGNLYTCYFTLSSFLCDALCNFGFGKIKRLTYFKGSSGWEISLCIFNPGNNVLDIHTCLHDLFEGTLWERFLQLIVFSMDVHWVRKRRSRECSDYLISALDSNLKQS